MTQSQNAWYQILIVNGLLFCATGQDKELIIGMFEKARNKHGEDFVVKIKNGVETLEGGIHKDRVAELWSF